MSFIGGVVREALSIKIKSRHDTATDQFSRIFMSKMFIIAAFVMSIDFFSDRVSCIVGNDILGPKEFVHSACWIQGFYVYEALAALPLYQATGYYGMPKNIDFDGIQADGELCSLIKKTNLLRDPVCRPLRKTYYNQYQYFSFYVAGLAVLFYLPYLLFRVLNTDLISIEEHIKKDECNKANANRITDRYFNYIANGGVFVLRLRTVANLLLKAIYLTVNVGGFLFTNNLLNRKFLGYGYEWVKWVKQNNTIAHDNKHLRGYPKPGNVLLPTMGLCDLSVGSGHRTTLTVDDRRFVCEISTHILYQYVLLVLWFVFVAGIVMASVGFVLYMGQIVLTLIKCSLLYDSMYSACRHLTLREIEYMLHIKKNNYALYPHIIRNIHPTNETYVITADT